MQSQPLWLLSAHSLWMSLAIFLGVVGHRVQFLPPSQTTSLVLLHPPTMSLWQLLRL
ncbi:hypothetical protein B0H12DRAFT_1095511 [Mycena haematopus]|nr:hypothetical protein B0H12DRAFT_1095511 [Mycena haematopus]